MVNSLLDKVGKIVREALHTVKEAANLYNIISLKLNILRKEVSLAAKLFKGKAKVSL